MLKLLERTMFLPLRFSVNQTLVMFTRRWIVSYQKICKIKFILIKNGYSKNVSDKCVKEFLDKVFISKRKGQTAKKKPVAIVLPYMGMISTEIKVKLHITFKQLLPACGLRVIFKIFSRAKYCFNFKDTIK